MNPLAPLQKNPVFKYFASVKLAVPLMTALLIASAAGTVFESRYNADIATIYVYRAPWFIGLLLLLWLNIFCATVARWPFRKHHTGFVITHLGLLTLLVGGIMTAAVGIDGQLRVVEGQADNEVFLPGLVVKTVSESGQGSMVRFQRRIRPASGSELEFLNARLDSGLYAEKFLPFVAAERGYAEQEGGRGTAIRFTLKSPFFEVTEWLHSLEKPELKMGPATLRLVRDVATTPAMAKKLVKPLSAAAQPRPSGDMLIVKRSSGEIAARVSIAELKRGPKAIGPVRIHLVQAFRRATVADNKLAEGGSGENPALELRAEHQGKSFREIVFAKFEGFTLNPNGVFGLSFAYQAAGGMAAANESGHDPSAHGVMAGSDRSGNVVEFHFGGKDPKAVRLELYKDGKQVLNQEISGAKPGEPVQTPWMGMTVRVEQVLAGVVESQDVRSIDLPERSQLPPSAIRFRQPASGSSQGFWLMEGEAREIATQSSQSGRAQVYYGQDSIRLPFAVKLLKFSKVDYPGTEMAMSYESEVQVDSSSEKIRIAMNEPLKRDGYTLYQSSYILQPGQPPVSIFSVNRDPGRAVKYFGSILLCVGIVVFTVMRSRWYLDRSKRRA